MTAIGLLDIPPEIQLQIAEFVETGQTLKALSVISRSLRCITQSILFKKLRIDLGTDRGLRGSVADLLANPRICAAICFLELSGSNGQSMFSSTCPRNAGEQLSVIQKMLPEMVGLRKVSISHSNLSNNALLDAFLWIAANKPLQISLGWNIYPCGVIPTPHTPLQISHLHLTVDHSSLEFCRLMFHASATTLTGLDIMADGDNLVKLADINLPFLHDFTLWTNERSATSATAFITAQRAIRKLILTGSMRALLPIPPNALPNLRELTASTEQVSQLVPGRPVEAIEVTLSHREYDQDWFREEVEGSTARVRMLRVHPKTAILNTRMLKRMATILPSLEHLWLPMCNDVSWPFRSITQTLAAHLPLDTPQCCRSAYFIQVPQEPTLHAVSSHSMGRPQHQ